MNRENQQSISVSVSIPSLQQIVTDSIVQNLHSIKLTCLSYLAFSTQPVDSNLILPILCASGSRMTPEIMISLEYVCPHLAEDTFVYHQYWRNWVLRKYQSRLVLFPFPELVNYVHELKRLLFVSGENEIQLLSTLSILQKIPFSIVLAKQTEIAWLVNTLGKQTPFSEVREVARNLTAKWKDIYKQLQKNQESTDQTSPAPLAPELHPCLESPQILTWKRLYFYSEEETTRCFHRASNKVSEMIENMKSGKRAVCSSFSVAAETDERKKKRLATRIDGLKIPVKKRKEISAPEVRVRHPPVVPLHQQRVEHIRSSME